jgi:hypothetical protein
MARTGDLASLPSAMRETVTSVQDKDEASLPGRDAARVAAGGFALPHGIPGQPGEQEGHGAGESPEHVLTTVVSCLSGQLTWRPRDAPTPGRRPKYPVLCPG